MRSKLDPGSKSLPTTGRWTRLNLAVPDGMQANLTPLHPNCCTVQWTLWSVIVQNDYWLTVSNSAMPSSRGSTARLTPPKEGEIPLPKTTPGRRWRRSAASTEAVPRPHPNHAVGARHAEQSMALQRDAEQRSEKRTEKRTERTDAGQARMPQKDGLNHVNKVKSPMKQRERAWTNRTNAVEGSWVGMDEHLMGAAGAEACRAGGGKGGTLARKSIYENRCINKKNIESCWCSWGRSTSQHPNIQILRACHKLSQKANVFLTDSEVRTFNLLQKILLTALQVRHEVSVGPISFCETIPLGRVHTVRVFVSTMNWV